MGSSHRSKPCALGPRVIPGSNAGAGGVAPIPRQGETVDSALWGTMLQGPCMKGFGDTGGRVDQTRSLGE